MKSLGSISAVFSSPVFDPPEKGEERGFISRTAAGYRAYEDSSPTIKQCVIKRNV